VPSAGVMLPLPCCDEQTELLPLEMSWTSRHGLNQHVMSSEEAFMVTSGLWGTSKVIGEPPGEELRPVLDESAELELLLNESEEPSD